MLNQLIIRPAGIVIFVSLLLLVASCSSSEPNFSEDTSLDSLALTHSYTRQFGTTRYDEATHAVTDTAGNLYVTVDSRPYSGNGITDAYLYKYDSGGNFLQKTSPVSCCDFAYHHMTSVSKSRNGPVYVIGYYYQDKSYMYIARIIGDGSLRRILTLSEASTSLRPHAIIANSPYEVYLLFSRISNGTERVYIMKYDPYYRTVWWETYIGLSERGGMMTLDPEGNIYTVIPINGGWQQRNDLLAKYNSAGSILWSKVTHPYVPCGTASIKQRTVNDIATDAGGNVYLVGTINTVNCDSSLHQDAYIRKYDNDGNILWTERFGTSTIDTASSLGIDASGNIYVAGSTLGSMQPNVTNKGEYDAYLRKFDTNGNTLQTRQFGTPKGDSVYDLTTAPNGNVYVMGSTWGTLQSPRIGSFDAYFRKYTP